MYPIDLTDSAWQVIEEILADKRKRKYSLKSIFNALLYVTKTGCQWRQLPKIYHLGLSAITIFGSGAIMVLGCDLIKHWLKNVD